MFQGLKFSFNGKDGEISPRQIISCLAMLESDAKDPNRVREEEPHTFDMGINKVAIVYQRILNFAGIECTDLDIALKFREDPKQVTEAHRVILGVVTALRPPTDYKPKGAGGKKKKTKSQPEPSSEST